MGARKQGAAVAAAAVGLTGLAGLGAPARAVVAGAGYTTFDAVEQGCLTGTGPNGVNCNRYETKDDVYMSGGPTGASLSDGSYFFAVLVPGAQASGFTDGSKGNLSDTTAGGTAGDAGSGDAVTDRTFLVTSGAVSYAGTTHAEGTSPKGHPIIGLADFDDTDNPGGVYILAICQTGATSASQCKYDAFKVQDGDGGGVGSPFGVVSGAKYYDANANGQRDAGEVGIAGWPISYVDGVSDTFLTDAQGEFSLTMTEDEYTFSEVPGAAPWVQTGNTVDQATTDGAGASDALNADKTYTVVVTPTSSTSGILFGNLCVGAGGGHTLGFWSNKNGQAATSPADLAVLRALSLRNANGSDFEPGSAKALSAWLLKATATNMAYMLSAQLAAMQLNVLEPGFVNGTALVQAPGTTSANGAGFATVDDLIAEANAVLLANPVTVAAGPARTHQEAIKTALDRANNNLSFVQATPADCPAPPAIPAPGA